MNRKSLFITAAAIALSASVVSSAMAQRTVINTNQNNVAKAIAETNAGITRTNASVGGTVTATAAAIGNTASIDVGRVATVNNTQTNNALVSSALNLTSVNNVKDVTATSAAIANSATVKVANTASPEAINLTNTQRAWGGVQSRLNSSISGVTGKVEQTSAAIGNSFSAEVSGPVSSINTYQAYWGDVSSQ